MRALRAMGSRGVSLDEGIIAPGSPGRGEVLVAPVMAGICGTDVKEFRGVGLSTAENAQTLGHEFMGRVVEVGSDVSAIHEGDRVAVMPFRHCGECRRCHEGAFHLCPSLTVTGLNAPGGGFADLVMVDSYQVTRLDELSDAQGALIEPAAVSLTAIVAANVGVGDTVLVVGAGPIGGFAILAALAAGVRSIFVVDPNPWRAKLAESLGDVTVLAGDWEDQLDLVRAETGDAGVDVALDCAGRDGTFDLCLRLLNTGGRISVPSVRPTPVDVDLRTLTRKNASIVGTLGYSRETWRRTVQLISQGALPVEKLVTAEIPRSRIIEEGFEALVAPDSRHMKILVSIDG